MDADVARGRERRAFALVVVLAMALVFVAWTPTPLAGMPTVLLQGLPAWFR